MVNGYGRAFLVGHFPWLESTGGTDACFGHVSDRQRSIGFVDKIGLHDEGKVDQAHVADRSRGQNADSNGSAVGKGVRVYNAIVTRLFNADLARGVIGKNTVVIDPFPRLQFGCPSHVLYSKVTLVRKLGAFAAKNAVGADF